MADIKTGRLRPAQAWTGLLFGIILVLSFGCRSATLPPATGAERPLTKVVVGYVPILISAPLFVAQDKGYYREQGLDITLEPLAGGADMIVQTAAGHFDIGTGGVGAAMFNASERGLEFKIVAPLHAESPPMTTPLVTSKAAFDRGSIRRPRDLKGLKVAINARGAATEYWLDAALAKDGLHIGDIDLVAIPFQDVPAALENGSIAGAMLGEPFTTLAEQRGIAVRIADDFLRGAQPTAVYYNGIFLRDRRAAGEAFMIAYLKAARDLYGEGWKRDENVAIIEKYTKVPADVIRAAAAPIHDPNGRVNIADLEKQQQFFMEQGLLTYKTPLDIRALVDSSFAEHAVQVLGEFKAP